MDWKEVGTWLKDNAGTGAALVGSLLTGNIPGAVAAGVSLVAGATGEANPDKALAALQTNPETMLRLKQMAMDEQASIREHIRLMEEARLKDAQAEHKETQDTIRAGDAAEDVFVRRTRPAQSWLSLVAGIVYLLAFDNPSPELALILFTLPWAYAGLRQIGKGLDILGGRKAAP